MPTRVNRDVDVGLRSLALSGHLTVPDDAAGVVLFVPEPGAIAPADGLAGRFVDAGLGTLQVDLVTADERVREADGPVRDIELLAVRVLAVTRWLHAHPDTRDRSVAYFGSGVGADVALLAAAEDSTVVALVAQDGHLDLVASRVSAVQSPTLLVVDGTDGSVSGANRDAIRRLRCEHALVVVPAASDPTATASATDAVADHSIEWITRYLRPVGRSDTTTIREDESS